MKDFSFGSSLCDTTRRFGGFWNPRSLLGNSVADSSMRLAIHQVEARDYLCSFLPSLQVTERLVGAKKLFVANEQERIMMQLCEQNQGRKVGVPLIQMTVSSLDRKREDEEDNAGDKEDSVNKGAEDDIGPDGIGGE